jgi:hypothetical protein
MVKDLLDVQEVEFVGSVEALVPVKDACGAPVWFANGGPSGAATADEGSMGRKVCAEGFPIGVQVASDCLDRLRTEGDGERLVALSGPVQGGMVCVQVPEIADSQGDDLLGTDTGQPEAEDNFVPATHRCVVHGSEEFRVCLLSGQPPRRVVRLRLSEGGSELAQGAVTVGQVLGGRGGDT